MPSLLLAAGGWSSGSVDGGGEDLEGEVRVQQDYSVLG